MKTHDVMTSTVCAVDARTTLRQAADLMADFGIGALPVLTGNYLLGIVTDRDIVVRGVARGLPLDTPVSAVMTGEVQACRLDEDAADLLLDMELLQLRRLPVVDDDNRLVGMLSLSDLAGVCSDEAVGRTLKSIFGKQEEDQPKGMDRGITLSCKGMHHSPNCR